MNKLSEDKFIQIIETIEEFHTKKNFNNLLSGRIVYFFDDFIERQNNGVLSCNTKVEDIESVTGTNINRTFLGEFYSDGYALCTIRRPKAKEFKGLYKYVPQKAVVLEQSLFDFDTGKVTPYKFAAIQQENYHFKLLDRNNTLSLRQFKSESGRIEVCEKIEWIIDFLINSYFEITEQYGLAYSYGIDTTYIFSMSLSDIKESLKNREKDNLRKSVLPTVVTKNGKQFLRMGSNGFDLEKRHFYFVSGMIGTNIISISNKDNLMNRETSFAARNGDSMVMSKNKQRGFVTSI